MSAIKEVLSRKMFSQGGLLGPEKPREPTGILASSEPLMKAAKFANGGSTMVPEFQGQDAIQLQDVPFMETYFPSVQAEQARRKKAALEGKSQFDEFVGNLNPEIYQPTGNVDTVSGFPLGQRAQYQKELSDNFYQSPKIKSYLERAATSFFDPDRRTTDQVTIDQIVSAVAGEMVSVRPDLKGLIEQGAQEYAIQVGTNAIDGASVPGAEKFITNYIANSNKTDRSMQERIRLLQEAKTETLPEELSEAALSKMSDEQKAQAFSDRVTKQRQVGLDAEQKKLDAEQKKLDDEQNKREAEETALAQSLANRGPEATVMTGLSPETIRSPDRIDQIRPEVLGPDAVKEALLAGGADLTRTSGITPAMQESIERLENYSGKGKTKEEQKDFKKSEIASFIKEFKDVMPDYEGKTEYEKGMDLVALAAAIGAGKSTHALVNVAEGLKETIPLFTSDEKEKREFEKQINLTSAQYGLEQYNLERTQAKADERQVFTYYDKSKVNDENPYGTMTMISMADIIKNGGKLPKGFTSEAVVLKEIDELKALEKLTFDALKTSKDSFRVDYKESKQLKEELDGISSSLISGAVGRKTIDSFLNILNDPDQSVTGAKGAFFELFRKGLATLGMENKKYNTRAERIIDMKILLQKIIPITLGSTQSANSISNRDVELLANAYLDSGFLSGNDVFSSLTTANVATLTRSLEAAREQFAEAEELGLSNYQQFISNIKGTTGRYGEASFQPSIERLSPYVKELSGDTPVTYKLEDIFNRETGTFNEGFSFDKGNVADLRAQGRKNLLYEEPDDNKVKPAATVVPLP
jgi:hypothetical protein